MSNARKSKLVGAMQKMALQAEETVSGNTDGQQPPTGDGQTGAAAPSLSLAPPPDSGEEERESSPVQKESEGTPEAAVTGAVSVEPPRAMEQHAADPEHASPKASTRTAPPIRKSARVKDPVQTAQVRAGVGQLDLSSDLVHLRQVMQNGRDQRRYVEDLPRRSDKGTYMRLPVHLQDALSEYCDRNSAPMADFIAAVLDAYFRDIGLLPPSGEGHHPSEEFLDKLRKESRTYDY